MKSQFRVTSTRVRVGAVALLSLAACAVPTTGDGTPAPDNERVETASFAASKSDKAMTRALARLHTHAEIKAHLAKIKAKSKTRMQVGPLIKNGNNGGLIDIDVPLPQNLPVNHDACGEGATPSIRQAVTCTVPAGERGNKDPNRIGYSTHGRDLWAVRLGNPNGVRVAYWTQQHGNEIESTEAAIDVIESIASGERWAKTALQNLDILVVLRANPDGGEVGPDCFLPPYAVGSVVGSSTCGLTRYNVDRTAGGGYQADSEPGFFGVVGRGYDMNRYHYPNLDGAIRPVEVQALVAATLAFQPKHLLDLHGDIGKGACTIDMATLAAAPYLGGLPSAKCVEHTEDGSFPADELIDFSMIAGQSPSGSLAQLQRRKLGANIINAIQSTNQGLAARFTQIAVGAGVIPDTQPYTSIGVQQAGWETRTISSIGVAVMGVKGGAPQVGLGPDTGFDAEYLGKGIKINRIALRESLTTLAKFANTAPTDDGGYCAVPIATGLVNTLPESFFGPNPYSESPVLIPLLPGVVPFQYFDDCQ